MKRKFRLSLVLPAVLVSITATLNIWANQVDWMFFADSFRAPGRFVRLDGFIVYGRLIWRGVNAPTYPLCMYGLSGTPWTLGLGLGGLMYLVAVGVLWYLVGQSWDRRRGIETFCHRDSPALKRTITIVLLIWGAFLLAFTIFSMFRSVYLFPNATLYSNLSFLIQNRPYVPCTVILFLAWSMILIIVNGITLTRDILEKSSRRTSGAE